MHDAVRHPVMSKRARGTLVLLLFVAVIITVSTVALPVGAQTEDPEEIQVEVLNSTVASGEEITIEATLDKTPVANGSVIVEADALNNTAELTTNTDGQATFRIPDADSVGIVVFAEEQDAFGEKQLIGEEDTSDPDADDPDDQEFGEIDIEVVSGTVAGGEQITIEAVLDSDPVANGTVLIESDTQRSETKLDADGRTNLTIPDADYVSVFVEAKNATAFGQKQLLEHGAEDPPDENPPSKDGPGVKGAIEINIVNDTVRRGEEMTIQATFENDPVVNASVRVKTGSEETPVKTRTDENGQASFIVPETEVVVITVVDAGRDAFGEKQLFGTPDNGPSEDTEFNITITDTTIKHTDGPAPDGLPTVDAFVAGDMLQVQLKTAPNTGISGRDLTAIGATTDTEFEITVTTTSFEPRLMIGAGSDVTWEYSVNDNSTEITITTKPVGQQLILPDDGQPPRIEDWPEGAADQATTNWELATDFAIDSASGPGQQELRGGYIMTDAQAFSTPVYFPPRGSQSPRLEVDVAGPHLTVAGGENDGFYRAKLPETLLEEWNVSGPSDLSAAYKGSQRGFTTTDVDDGLVIELDVAYSSGTVEIKPTANGSAPDNETGDNTSTEPADPDGGLVAFRNTTRPGEVAPNSLGGKIRAEAAVADDIEVELLRDTAENYSLAITAPDGTENVTFYLQSQAIESSQDIDNLTMYLDSERQKFYIDENAGPGQSPWLGFEVDEFSTRTVTFSSASTTGDETGDGILSVASESADVAPGENVTLTYTVNNVESQDTSYTLAVNSLSPNLTVTDIAGDIKSTKLEGDRPTATTTSLAAGSSGTVTISYQAAADTTGQATVDVSAEEPLSGAATNVTSTLTIQEIADPTQRVLTITGKSSLQELTQNDVTATITRFNRGQSVNNVGISQDDVTTVITLFERN